MDYSQTVHLPKTSFPMKGELPKQEPKWLEFWAQKNIYARLREKGKGRPKYVLHDGPPYANGEIHLGHAQGNLLKDFVVKYKSLRGFDSPYVPGWDCHGLPIETQMLKGKPRDEAAKDPGKFRKGCRAYAQKYVDLQREQFKALGMLGDWDHPYITMDFEYEARTVEVLGELLAAGYLERRFKPVHWCMDCQTALAEAELEYHDHASPSIYVKFRVNQGLEKVFPSLAGKPAYALIWTTTPWTLPANVAVAFNPEFEYVAAEHEGEVWILAKDRLQTVAEKTGWTPKILDTKKGSQLESLGFEHPLNPGWTSRGVLADYVSKEDGTGCVHIAPGHGDEDYRVGTKYKLEIVSPVNERGLFTEEILRPTAGNFSRDASIGSLIGKHVFKANSDIVTDLKNKNLLVFTETISHSYPHCWRCKNPVIFRATKQWFLSLDHKDLRQRLVQAADKVRWYPDYGKKRMQDMVSNRSEWCISRQRFWGVPIPVFVCGKCGEAHATPETFKKVAAEVRQGGTDVWFEKPIEAFLAPGARCAKCGGEVFEKGNDILDVWFDSGASHAAVLEQRAELGFPSDLYLEGPDQYRGWFQSSLILAVARRDQAPYREVYKHGWVLDGQGRAMHKSLGNVIAPQDIMKKNGADLLRLWVSSEDGTEDMRLSPEILDRVVETYRRLRNTFRYLLGNLNGFEAKDALPHTELLDIDRFALHELGTFIGMITNDFDSFKFYNAYQRLHEYCGVTLSSFFFDMLKDRLYTFPLASKERRSAQTVLFEILKVLVRVASPIISFTCEEVWQASPLLLAEAESVYLSDWPKSKESWIDKALYEDWIVLMNIRSYVSKALEIKRAEKLIGGGLESQVTIYCSTESVFNLLSKYAKDLSMVFIVSKVSFTRGFKDAASKDDDFSSKIVPGVEGILVERASGTKCPRCWNYSEYVGKDATHPELCERCVKNIT